MIPALLVALGTLVALASVAVAAAAAASNRLELFRWVTERGLGADAARTLLFAPARVTRGAAALTSAGVLVAALGLSVVVSPLPALLLVVGVAVIAVPLVLGASYACGRAVGRRWPERSVRIGVPWVDRLGGILAPVRTTTPVSGDRQEGTGAFSKDGTADRLGTEELTAVSGVLSFAQRPVRDVMTPRTDIVAVREAASLEEIGKVFTESGYARIPVYHESLDNITNMIYAFDLLKVEPGGKLPERPVATAPASKPCGDLLFQMQRDRQQLAIVLDEYGGTAGIVTFDDLARGLVNGIFHSPDGVATEPPADVEVIEVTGTTSLGEIARRFDVALEYDVETVGGALARAAGRIPAAGERFELGSLEFDILRASATRVERIAVRRGSAPLIRLDAGDVT